MTYPPQVPSDVVQKWQEVVDLLAEIMHIPAALIMRAELPDIKVFVSSDTQGNPYEVASLNTGVYCRTVMTTGQALLVPDGRLDERWKSSTDTKLGMVSYLGVPINWPDGEVFGTICVYDNKRNDYSELYLRLLLLWRDVLQADLRTLATLHSQLAGRDARIRRLVEANIIGIGMWQLEPQAPEPYDATYFEANDAFLGVVGYDRDDLATGRIRRAGLTPLEWRDRTAQAHTELTMTGTFQPYEKEFIRKDGSRVPVLIGGASFEEDGSQGVAFVLDLTERKHAEEAARRSEKELRDFVETIPAMVWSALPDGSVDFSNRRWQEFTGLSLEGSLGWNWVTAVHPEDVEPYVPKWRASAATGQPFEAEVRIRGADGEYRWFLENAVPLRDDQGNILKWYGFVVDIEDRKRADEAARRSEKELRDVVETIPAMVWSALPDGSVDFINRRWQEFTGLSLEGSLGWNWVTAIHPEDVEPYVARWRASVATGQPFEAEVRIRGADGENRWFSDRAVPLRDEQGTILKWYGLMVDIEARKRAEYLTGQVFESSPDAMCVVGRDYRFQRVNPVFERVWGMPPERIVGKHVGDLLGTTFFEQRLKPNYDRCFAGKEVRYAEWFSYPFGRRYLLVTYSPLRPHSEQVEAALVVTRDVTDHMLASEALRAAQADLAHANRLATMGQLTASIAHEVSQPIAGVVTNAQTGRRWLGAAPPNLEEARHSFDRIVKDGSRAGDVIGRIRGLVKKAPPLKARFDLNEAVHDVIALTRSEVLKHGVSLETQLATDLAPVEGDRVQLQQVILNLILNAVEAMSGLDEGARELRIGTEREASGGVRVTVLDSGPGLDPQSMDRLFEAFYTTKPAGMGMGLAICRSIIEAHGGRLWAEANEPRGAVFQFTLPPDRDETAPAELAGHVV